MFPCAWGPISMAKTTYARGRDFGNYQSAPLVVRKELEPSGDPGRFDLLVNSRVVVAAAGDGSRRMVAVGPGVYTVSEAAVAGTNPADYRSTVECKRDTRRNQVRAGGVYERLTLSSGERVVCTFRNVRNGAPAIAIDKTGPATAGAGETLRYTLYVTNPGYVPFPAASVRVTDPNCDDPPSSSGRVVMPHKARSTQETRGRTAARGKPRRRPIARHPWCPTPLPSLGRLEGFQ
jgi:hypothetical protein